MSRLALLEWLQTHAQLVQPEALAVERAMEKEDLFYIDDLRGREVPWSLPALPAGGVPGAKCHRLLEDSTRS